MSFFDRLLKYTAVQNFQLQTALDKDFDLDKMIWTIPARRTSNNRALIIPISKKVSNLIEIQIALPDSHENLFAQRKYRLTESFRLIFLKWALDNTYDEYLIRSHLNIQEYINNKYNLNHHLEMLEMWEKYVDSFES